MRVSHPTYQQRCFKFQISVSSRARAIGTSVASKYRNYCVSFDNCPTAATPAPFIYFSVHLVSPVSWKTRT